MKGFYPFLLAFVTFHCNGVKTSKSLETICFDSNSQRHVQKISINDNKALQEFDKKFVEIEGIFYAAFEQTAIYPTRSFESEEAIWISFPYSEKLTDSALMWFDNQRVSVTGRVNISEKGHLEGYKASLDSIFCIKKI